MLLTRTLNMQFNYTIIHIILGKLDQKFVFFVHMIKCNKIEFTQLPFDAQFLADRCSSRLTLLFLVLCLGSNYGIF